jgi:hypothetical protein
VSALSLQLWPHGDLRFERNWWMFIPGRKAAIAWPTSTVGLPSHGKQRKHHQVMAGPPDVTPAVDHHVRLATTPSIGIAGRIGRRSLPAFQLIGRAAYRP